MEVKSFYSKGILEIANGMGTKKTGKSFTSTGLAFLSGILFFNCGDFFKGHRFFYRIAPRITNVVHHIGHLLVA